MTRFIHDQFAKQYLRELLSPLGTVETEKEISSEIRTVDVYFTPTDSATGNRKNLGLLGRLTTTPAIFEPFRNPITKSDIRSCLGKLFSLHADLEREANRNKTNLSEETLPQLWILTPTASSEILNSFHAFSDEKNWETGMYFLGTGIKTGIVVIHQLPKNSETLWLRLLGRGRVQQQAVAELKGLPKENRFRENVIELVYELISILAKRQKTNLDRDEEELIMTLTEMYEEVMAEVRQEMLEELRPQMLEELRPQMLEELRPQMLEELRPQMLEELRPQLQEEILLKLREEEKQKDIRLVETLLRMRFETLDEELTAIIDPIALLPSEEFAPLILQLSREELLTRFKQEKGDRQM